MNWKYICLHLFRNVLVHRELPQLREAATSYWTVCLSLQLAWNYPMDLCDSNTDKLSASLSIQFDFLQCCYWCLCIIKLCAPRTKSPVTSIFKICIACVPAYYEQCYYHCYRQNELSWTFVAVHWVQPKSLAILLNCRRACCTQCAEYIHTYIHIT